MASIDEQLAAVERKAAQLKERKRKQETRKKILMGAAFMLLPEDQRMALLDQAITAERDRKLVGLPPKQQPDPEPEPDPAQEPEPEPEYNYDYDPNDPFGGI